MKPSMDALMIEVVQDKHLAGVARLLSAFLNSKHFCCCLPLGMGENNTEAHRKRYHKYPAMMESAAVATVDGKVVGFIQVVLEGMPCDLHKAKPGEAYIEFLTVDPEARGMGIGTKLLKWSEELALSRSCHYMSLEVIGGNPAIGLYERKGYIVQPASCITRLIGFCVVCLLVSPLICPAGSSWYCNYGQSKSMKKDLK